MSVSKRLKDPISSQISKVGRYNPSNIENSKIISFVTDEVPKKKTIKETKCRSTQKTVYSDTKRNSAIKSILDELRELKHGWSGPESVAPSIEICTDVDKLLKILNPASSKNFDLWVDDDGTVTFFWHICQDVLFSVDIYGDGKARCTYTPGKTGKSEFGDFEFSNSLSILSFVSSKVKKI